MRLNGCRERRLRTPRHREGGYFPDEVLRPYSRTDRAMVGAIEEVYKLGAVEPQDREGRRLRPYNA